ncbi:EAL domain-containing protein [uncultured Cohaesibacter sp.]|uniref:EAL domain-containing protein n=1 Tax=uncultured Cohaesibacter sp. TaxID=1002546 RepID=UPI0029C8D29B|nr:EAL domain-containing protein [uncultured Cohaesibacter sp.]
MKRAPLYRILTFLVIVVCCILANRQGWFQHVDHAISEQRMAASTHPASGDIILLEIDNKSLTSIGVWPWNRSIYADIIDKSFQAGAEELAFDIDFSSNSTDSEDEAFANALEEADGPVTLAVFQQFATSHMDEETIRFNRPIEKLATRAWLATVNVIADLDGIVRSFPLAQSIEGEIFPSLTSTLGGTQNIVEASQIINFNIDPETIPTYSVIDLLQDKLPQDALQGRKILIGAGAAELRDTMAVPVFGVLSGPKLQIVAAENLLQGTNLKKAPASWTHGLAAALLVPIAFILLFRKFNSFGRIAGLILVAGGVEWLGYHLYSNDHILLDTATVLAILLITAAALTLFEIGVKSFMLTLSHKHGQSISDLLDTIVTDSLTGIVIVDDEGRVMSISRQAQKIFASLGYRTQKDMLISEALPEEFADRIRDCLDMSTPDQPRRSMQSQEIRRGEKVRYFEYSLTPSFIAPDGEDLQEEGRLVTLLFQDITDSYLEQKRLEYAADHDPLTDLLNMQGFCNALEARSSTGKPLSQTIVFACQARRLDKVNQMLGPDYSEILIRQIGKSLQGLAQFDCIGCTNQKTFLLASHSSKTEDMASLAETLQQCLETPFNVRGHSIIVGAQIGSAAFDESDMRIARELAEAAIIALDRAHDSGDNLTVYSPALAAEVKRERLLEQEILGAFERDEFELYYQPQVDLQSGKVIGCEALARWNHSELGLIRPDHFIPILEETGKIVDLGRWIMKTACQEAMSWPEEASVAVNVSAVQFQRTNIMQDICEALELSGLPKERLHIEITESLFIADSSAVIDQLNAIRKHGVKIALDDFGTGYSSLSYIHQFPLDKIKIDRAFIKDLPYSTESMAVINAVTALAQGFDMKIIAEGMENAEQAEALRTAGCHLGQGYFFGKPMNSENFSAFLIQNNEKLRLSNNDSKTGKLSAVIG